MAKRKRASKSPSTSSPAKKERPKELQDPAASVSEAPEAPHDQGHPVQHVPQDVPQDLPQDVPQDLPQDTPRGVQQDFAQDVPQVVPQEDPRDQISMFNAIDSPLLRLPAELRNKIFAYLYTKKYYDLELDNYHGYRRVIVSGLFAYLWRDFIRLSLVCRQVRAETALLPYKLGSFFFIVPEGGSHLAVVGMRLWLERLSPRQLHATGEVTFIQWPTQRHDYWVQTRTATYWLAKLDGMVFASDVEMYSGVPMHFDIANFGPSDH